MTPQKPHCTRVLPKKVFWKSGRVEGDGADNWGRGDVGLGWRIVSHPRVYISCEATGCREQEFNPRFALHLRTIRYNTQKDSQLNNEYTVKPQTMPNFPDDILIKLDSSW